MKWSRYKKITCMHINSSRRGGIQQKLILDCSSSTFIYWTLILYSDTQCLWSLLMCQKSLNFTWYYKYILVSVCESTRWTRCKHRLGNNRVIKIWTVHIFKSSLFSNQELKRNLYFKKMSESEFWYSLPGDATQVCILELRISL